MGADVKIMDRFFRHRELPDSENFSKPGFHKFYRATNKPSQSEFLKFTSDGLNSFLYRIILKICSYAISLQGKRKSVRKSSIRANHLLLYCKLYSESYGKYSRYYDIYLFSRSLKASLPPSRISITCSLILFDSNVVLE